MYSHNGDEIIQFIGLHSFCMHDNDIRTHLNSPNFIMSSATYFHEILCHGFDRPHLVSHGGGVQRVDPQIGAQVDEDGAGISFKSLGHQLTNVLLPAATGRDRAADEFVFRRRMVADRE